MDHIYCVGKNIPGYLPESSPYYTLSWEAACDAMASDLDECLEAIYQGDIDHDELDESLKETEDKISLLRQVAKSDPKDHFFGYSIYVDIPFLSLHFWIETVTRGDLQIPNDAEGDELDAMLETINDGY